MRMDLGKLATEKRNEQTMELDTLSTEELLRLMNQEDQTVANAVSLEIPQITKVADAIIQSFNQEGRLIYMGAGTSG